jgi:hypothetical protein
MSGKLPLHVGNIGRFGPILSMYTTNNAGGAAWPANNRALYFPVHLPAPFLVARGYLVNDGNNTGNVDIGVYTIGGTRLVSSGSTARGSTNATQYIDLTDTWLSPGDYYWALVASSTSGVFTAVASGVSQCRADGMLQEDLGATTLPSSMSPAAIATANIPLFGFTQSATL